MRGRRVQGPPPDGPGAGPARIGNRAALLGGGLADDVIRRRQLALDLVDAGLASVEPARCTEARLRHLQASDRALGARRLWVLAFGKAAWPMARAALSCLPVHGGFVLGTQAAGSPPEPDWRGPLCFLPAEHPLPCDDAERHGNAVLDWARGLGAFDEVLALVSGGGSAMLELPADSLSLDDLRQTSGVLLSSGAAIEEVNAVRAALSQLKGGRLLAALAPARVVNVVLSDVPGGSLHWVASGPTLPPLEAPPARLLVERLAIEHLLPRAVIELLDRSEGQGPVVAPFGQAGAWPFEVLTMVAADNRTARQAMAAEAERRGLAVALLDGNVGGQAAEAGAAFYLRARALGTPVMVGGGETVVTVRGPGRGGRNHEFVLGALSAWQGGLALSVGTDGVDGTSGAAGALVDAEVIARLEQHPGDLAGEALRANDSGPLLDRLHAQLVTGPTGTNVADLCLYLS